MFGRAERRSASRERTKKPADVDLSDVCNHFEALMTAARYGNDELIFKLFLNNVDLGLQDDAGNTALHVAVMNGQQNVCRMLIVFSAPKPIWKVKNKAELTPFEVCPHPKIQDDLRLLMDPKTARADLNSRHNASLAKQKDWFDGSKVLLAFDGGGIRAVITIQILLHLNEIMGGQLMEKVDDIAGTSCGGVLALLLTTNNRSLEECRRFVVDMRDRVFCKNTVKWPKHSSNGIEYVAKHVTTWEDTPMSIIKKHRVMVTVVNTKTVPPELLLFRSFAPNIPEQKMEEHKFLDPHRVELWKALRCTTAAPYFFESFNGLSDGGLVANNPTLALISDFMFVNKLEKDYAATEEERNARGNRRMGLVLSVGTGIFPVEKIEGIDVNLQYGKNPFHMARSFYKAIANTKNMFNMLVKECTASNGQPVKYAREWCHSLGVPYYRFSPDLSQGISLDDTDVSKMIQVLWETEVYLATIRDELAELAECLLRKPDKQASSSASSSTSSLLKTKSSPSEDERPEAGIDDPNEE